MCYEVETVNQYQPQNRETGLRHGFLHMIKSRVQVDYVNDKFHFSKGIFGATFDLIACQKGGKITEKV